MLLNKAVVIIFVLIFCNLDKICGKDYSHGQDNSRRSSSSSQVISALISSHSHPDINSAVRSSSPKKPWSGYSTNEYVTSAHYILKDYKPVVQDDKPPEQDLHAKELGKVDTGSTTRDFSNMSPYTDYKSPIIIQSSLQNNFKGESESQKYNFMVKQPENLDLNIPLPFSFSSLRVHCQQQLFSEFNELGEIVDSVREICNPVTSVTTTPQPTTHLNTTTTTGATTSVIAPETSTKPAFKPYTVKEKRYERKLISTLRGINCRKVMNSEFNERGEIVDSVFEVCDPPTTTTTTTRKPTPKTTIKRPTTTRKPLIKVCRRVMNSYLNEAGEIIDSVTEVCALEPVK